MGTFPSYQMVRKEEKKYEMKEQQKKQKYEQNKHWHSNSRGVYLTSVSMTSNGRYCQDPGKYHWSINHFLSLNILTKLTILGKIKAKIYIFTLEMSVKLAQRHFILHINSI